MKTKHKCNCGGTMSYKSGGKHWIQGAINPKHKGFCTPITKSTCTGHRRALAMTFKKHHGFHHADGGVQEYGDGATIGSILGAIGGSLIAPGVGTGIGAYAGSYIGSQFDTTDAAPNISAPLLRKPTYRPTGDQMYGENQQLYPDGGKVKPYVAKTREDYQARQQAYNDSLVLSNPNLWHNNLDSLDYEQFDPAYERLTKLNNKIPDSSPLITRHTNNWMNNSIIFPTTPKQKIIYEPEGNTLPPIKEDSSSFKQGRKFMNTTGKRPGFYAGGGYMDQGGLFYPENAYNTPPPTAPNAEVEKSEVARTPQGKTIIFDGPSHANGGIQTYLPEGTEITSDQLINPLTGNTYAKDQGRIERNKNTQNKRLKDRPNDSLLKASIDMNEKKSQAVFDLQEKSKAEEHDRFMRNGGRLTYKNGGVTLHSYKYPVGGKVNPNDTLLDPRMGGFDQTGNPNAPQPIPQDAFLQRPDNARVYGTNPLQDFGNKITDNLGSSFGGGYSPGNIGLGVGLLGSAMQFGDSYHPQPVSRITNPYRNQAIGTYADAVNNQKNLRYGVSDQLSDNTSSEASTNRWINGNLTGGSAAGTRLGNRAITLKNRNSIYGDRNRANIGIQTQGNQMQEGLGQLYGGLGSEQAGYDYGYQDQTLRTGANARNNRYSALSNLSTILQGYGRDKDLMTLLPKMYPHSSI